MSVLWRFWLVLLIPAFAQVQVVARPTQPINTFISLPLQKVHLRDTTHEHPAVVHQQNVNSALRRYARMTGRSEPTQDELPKNLVDRSAIPSLALSKRYNREGLNKILDYLGMNSHEASAVLGGVKPAEKIAHPPGTGHNGGSHAYGSSYTASKASIGLTIQGQDIGYMGTLMIGTPPRAFQVIIDSGSADLWVGAEGCQDSDGNCGNHVFLGNTSSSTFSALNQTWSIQYGTGSVSGQVVQDVVSVAGLRLPSLKFGTASQESSQFRSVPFDGILGLAQSQILSRQQVPTITEALFAANLTSQPITSYRIPRYADHKNDGEVTFGGMDPARYDAKTLTTVINKSRLGFWEAPLAAIHVNGADLGWSNRTLILDTGTTLLIAPSKDVAAIHQAIPGAAKVHNTWTVPCTLKTPITFTIGNQTYSIDPRDIAFTPIDQSQPNGTCVSGIAEGNPGLVVEEWLAGDVFLKNVYFSTNEATDEISFANPV